MLINPGNLATDLKKKNIHCQNADVCRTSGWVTFDGSKCAQHLTERLSIDLALVTGDGAYTHRWEYGFISGSIDRREEASLWATCLFYILVALPSCRTAESHIHPWGTMNDREQHAGNPKDKRLPRSLSWVHFSLQKWRAFRHKPCLHPSALRTYWICSLMTWQLRIDFPCFIHHWWQLCWRTAASW